MKDKLTVAVLQMMTVADKEENLKRAREMLSEAAILGADLAVLPEMFNCPYDIRFFAGAAEGESGPSCEMLREEARFHNMVIVGGSIPERDGDLLYNTSFVFDADGNRIAKYRKKYLFDVEIPGSLSFQESQVITPGTGNVTFQACGQTFGLAICFDIRFPEYLGQLIRQGAKALIIPGSFNHVTGPVHWELLGRTRAVDNGAYVVMAAPARNRQSTYQGYGHSMVCDPWGTVCATAEEEEELVVHTLDFRRVDQIREELPLLKARRIHEPVL